MTAPALDVRGLSVDLDGRRILSRVSFQLRRGEFMGILGPNGAGKTTLFRALLGQLRLSEGTVQFSAAAGAGEAGRGDGLEAGPIRIGYVPQARQIDPELPLQVKDFVSLGLPHPLRFWLSRADKAAVHEAMEMTGCLHLAAKPIGRLSGGERQRAYLSQALVRKPQLLMLDEPTSNLDPGAQEQAAELVSLICRSRKIGILFISHDVNLIARYADQLLYLTPGRFAVGTVDEVMQASVLQQLYGPGFSLVRLDGKLYVTATAHDAGNAAICSHLPAELNSTL
ncbi:metal ABC transporter ATP-binding protein [Paenibacillus humicola]|uniref:metal ABC transporter ATP-binding protein n=1 Tax=Paenibacillus humicola TaxID=3110540 RepID=UPI00237ADA57|nr:metal ABC transporter ATP-binding protein [Paenibacillus humicola]